MVQLEFSIAQFEYETVIKGFIGINRIGVCQAGITQHVTHHKELVLGPRFLIFNCLGIGNQSSASFFEITVAQPTMILAAGIDYLDHRRVGKRIDQRIDLLRAAVAAAGIDPELFRVQVFGDDAPDRTAMIALALERHGIASGCSVDPADVVVIGDTPRDVQCARENGCRSLAVATGGCSEDELCLAGADVTVPDLRDPAPLMRLMGLNSTIREPAERNQRGSGNPGKPDRP